MNMRFYLYVKTCLIYFWLDADRAVFGQHYGMFCYFYADKDAACGRIFILERMRWNMIENCFWHHSMWRERREQLTVSLLIKSVQMTYLSNPGCGLRWRVEWRCGNRSSGCARCCCRGRSPRCATGCRWAACQSFPSLATDRSPSRKHNGCTYGTTQMFTICISYAVLFFYKPYVI